MFKYLLLGVVLHTLIPGDLCEFGFSLVYIVSAKPARATQGDPGKQKTNKYKNKTTTTTKIQTKDLQDLIPSE